MQEAVAEAEESGPDILTAVTLSVVKGPRELEFKPISWKIWLLKRLYKDELRMFLDS